MTTQSNDIQIALLIAEQRTMRRELDQVKVDAEKVETDLTAKLKTLEDERNKALKWGVMSLGSAVMGMGYWIFNQFTGGHIK